MSNRSKLILIGICVGIILAVFTVNVIRKVREDNPDKPPELSTTQNIMTRAEAYRLLSYLEYDKTEREAIPLGITYTDSRMSGWYDSYVNALWKMGLIDSNIAVSPEEPLTYGACKELVDKLIMINPAYQSVYGSLSFDFIKAEEGMRVPDFLQLYEALLASAPEEDRRVKEEILLVLGREVTEDGRDRIVTDRGKYYYQDAQSYERFYPLVSVTPNPSEAASQPTVSPAAGNVTATTTPTSGAASDSPENQNDSSQGQPYLVTKYMDKGVKAFTCDQELLYITGVTTEKIVIHNVWIKKGEGALVDTFVNGLNKSFQAKFKLAENIEKVVGDITVENQRVIQISVKPDKIHGKVLRIGEDFIEVEGYGEVPLDSDYRIYKVYGTLSMEPTGSILVGYENTDFVVSGGKISAAIITESIKAENIRVLIQTTEYKSIYHKKVELTATGEFTVSSDEGEANYAAGEVVTIEPDNELLEGQRISVKTASDDSKIQILSIERADGNPKYRGIIEISKGDEGLLIVNELPLEEYLYAVVPSEMPTSYGSEALKVQAVCARSYAYKHLLQNSLSQYGAHVNDSVTYQVYNNIAENEDSILAVKDTYGKIIEYNGEVINALYFSTSCGHTADAASAWANDVDYPYLNGKLLRADPEVTGTSAQNDVSGLYEDLSSEEAFRSFITDQDFETIDSSFQWYRWNVTMDIGDIEKVIKKNLATRYQANPNLILTMTSPEKDGKEAVFESLPVESIGSIKDIKVLKRESSGIITDLLIIGSKKTIKVLKEYNIRALLAPVNDTLIRNDGSQIANLNLLPSAFFMIDKLETDGELTAVTITGGGYGHGVGMSQNGVKAMVNSGKSYDEIVKYFYEGTTIGFIYE